MAITRKKHMYNYKGGKKKVKKTMKKDFKDKKAKYDKKADELQAKMEKKAGKMGKEALSIAKEQKKKLSAGLDKIQGTLSGKNQQRMQAARDKLKGAMNMMLPIIQKVGKTARPWIKAYMNMIKQMMTMYAAAVGSIASKAMGMSKNMGGPSGMLGNMNKMMGSMPMGKMMGSMPMGKMMGSMPMGAMMGNMGSMMKNMPGMSMMKNTPMGTMMGNMDVMGDIMKSKNPMEAMQETMSATMKDIPGMGKAFAPAAAVDRSGMTLNKIVDQDSVGGKYPLLEGIDKTKGDAKKHFKTIMGYIKKRFKTKTNYLNAEFKVSWEGKKKNPPLTGLEYVDRAKKYLDKNGKIWNISGKKEMAKTFDKLVNDRTLAGNYPLLDGIDKNKKPAKGKIKKIYDYIKKRFKTKANYVNPEFKVSWEGKKKNPPLTGDEYIDRAKIYLDPKGEIWKITEADVKAAKAKKGGRRTRKYRKHYNRRTRKKYY